MRKIALLLSAFLAITAFVNANPVDKETAKTIGAKFLKASTEMKNIDANGLEFVTAYQMNDGNDAFYVFNTESGFIIVAADDCATPILGYSTESQFVTDNLPIQMQEYLNDFVEEIQYGIEHETFKDEKTIHQWELVKTTGKTNENRNAKVVAPLLGNITWDQQPLYNALCPSNDDGQAVTGCVATAMGQIMKYWNKPTKGTGSHSYIHPVYGELAADFGATTYDWDNMPDALTDTHGTALPGVTEEQINAVATLLYHCGVSVEMDYGPDGSGADSRLVPDAIQQYFSYSYDSYDFRQFYSDEVWINKVKASLDALCPVYYTGQDTQNRGGHAFVCDGYDASDYLHFNWGWAGKVNGYFAVDALNPQINSHLTYYFNKYNFAIFNLHPNDVAISASYNITVVPNNTEYGSVSISSTNPYSLDTEVTVTASANTNYSFLYWTEGSSIVSTDATYTFKAEYSRDLVAQFAPTASLCEIIFELQDTYGDSWHTNNLAVTYADSKTEHLSLREGHNASFTRKVVNGSTINLAWIQGFYNELAQFFIKTTDNKVLYENTDISSDYSDTYTVDITEGTVKYYFTGAKDNNWSDADNWISKVKPNAEDAVTIKTHTEVDEDATVGSLTIDNYSYINIKWGKSLTVTGSITQKIESLIKIETHGQLVANSPAIVLMEKTITKYTDTDKKDWYTLSTPVHDEDEDFVSFDYVGNIVYMDPDDPTKPKYNLYYLDEENAEWVNNLNGDGYRQLDNGRGYLYRRGDDATLQFYGSSNVSDVTRTLTYTDHAIRGFNLIGNPFTHAITWDNVTATNVNNGYYLLNTDGGWVPNDNVGTTIIPIAPMEAFLVQANNTGASVTISNTAVSKSDDNDSDNVVFTVKNADYYDKAYIVFKEGQGLNKIEHKNAEIPMLYIINNGQNFAIADLNEGTDVIDLGFKAKALSHYTINIKADGDFDYLHLIDKITGEDVDMLMEEEYTFVGSPSDSEARFVVRLNKNTDGYSTESETFVYQNGNEVIVSGSGMLQVYDVTGRMVMHQEIIDNHTIDLSGLPRCVYIFRLTGDTVRTQKVVLQ
jgi:hypothetical protein